MQRLTRERPTGLTATGLRSWGLIFLAAGVAGTCVLENGILDLPNSSNLQLLEAMQSSSQFMLLVSVALILKAVQTCAVPIFCFLLVEGFLHTSDFKKYILRVLCLALLTEIPYNYAMSGNFLDMTSRNPVFGMVLCLAVLYFFSRYQERSFSNVIIKIVIFIAAFLWTAMLTIAEGPCCLFITLTIWALRDKTMYRSFGGAVVAILCTMFNPFYLAAPFSFLFIHFYNGEKGDSNMAVNYLAYPGILALFGAAATYLF